MVRKHVAADQILEVVRTHPECTLEELIRNLPGLSWFEIFHEVNHLSRSGQLRLSQSSLGLTTTLHAS